MSLFVFKLILTPLLLATATLSARRWGPVVGGWIVGLPLTSGPVSVFLALEQGRDFAAASAAGSILGLLAVICYCLAYVYTADKFAWPVAALAGLSCYFTAVTALSFVSLPLFAVAGLVAALIGAALFLEPGAGTRPAALPAPPWDLPFRMVAATTVVVVITALSSHLGPHLSGIFSTFPVFITVMTIFSHTLYGPASVHLFARGIIMGSFAFVAFFLTVALTIKTLNLFLVYLLAVLAAACTNMFVLLLHLWKKAR